MTLDELKIGQKARIISISDSSSIRRRLLDIGFTMNSVIFAYMMSPFKDPIAYKIKNAIIAIRNNDAKDIEVELL